MRPYISCNHILRADFQIKKSKENTEQERKQSAVKITPAALGAPGLRGKLLRPVEQKADKKPVYTNICQANANGRQYKMNKYNIIA
jgi:hypothetical protein